MKILGINSARSIWIVPTNFLNPRGRYVLPALQGLAERYKFVKLPDPSTSGDSPLNLKFGGGVFMGQRGVPIVVDLAVHDDGLIADTRDSTVESDAFLVDALSWFAKEYELPHHSELPIRRLYVSEMFFNLDKPLAIFDERYARFLERLERGLSNEPGKPLRPTHLAFGLDPAFIKQPVPFRIERALDSAFSENRYYSYAPVPTPEHIDLLEELERTL